MSDDKGNGWAGGRDVPSTKKPAAGNDKDGSWERDLVNKLAFSALNEQRKTRRWGIFFKLFFVGYLIVVLALFMADKQGDAGLKLGKHTALIDITGVIADNTEASADAIVTGMREAFEDKRTAGVILRINSPGGSPVQAGYVNDEIQRLREKHPDIPLYAVITDICASGGYYIAAAADKIYADKASIVGSIGVLMDGFGFTGAMEKLGVERRLLTAGESKGFLDPFSPEKEEDVAHVKALLDNIHKQFISVVKDGRGDRLKDDPKLFSGLIWTGEQGIELGLVDDLGSSSFVAREVVGEETIKNFTVRPDYFQRLAERIGVTISETLLSASGGKVNLR